MIVVAMMPALVYDREGSMVVGSAVAAVLSPNDRSSPLEASSPMMRTRRTSCEEGASRVRGDGRPRRRACGRTKPSTAAMVSSTKTRAGGDDGAMVLRRGLLATWFHAVRGGGYQSVEPSLPRCSWMESKIWEISE
jgi:hypothetical protein